MKTLALAGAFLCALALVSPELAILALAIFAVSFITPGFKGPTRTSCRRTWNLASYHSPHSLTWSWIVSLSRQQVMWPSFHASFKLDQQPIVGLGFGQLFSAHIMRNNNGWQAGFALFWLSISWSRQQPMLYRNLYLRDRDERFMHSAGRMAAVLAAVVLIPFLSACQTTSPFPSAQAVGAIIATSSASGASTTLKGEINLARAYARQQCSVVPTSASIVAILDAASGTFTAQDAGAAACAALRLADAVYAADDGRPAKRPRPGSKISGTAVINGKPVPVTGTVAH